MDRLVKRENVIISVVGSILVCLLCTGVILAAGTLSRHINVHVTDSLISVSGETTLEMSFDASGGTKSEPYVIQNTSTEPVLVDCTGTISGAGLTLTSVPALPVTLSLGAGESQSLIVTVTSTGAITEGSVTINFTPRQP